jgi:ABC-2 type transport system permease protein
MHAVLTIAAKDARQRLRDRSLILIAVVVPLTLAAIFGVTLHDAGGGRVHFEYAYADGDLGTVARLFRTRALGEAERRGIASVRSASSEREARRLADRGSVSAAFVLRRGFSSAVLSGRPAGVHVVGNIDRPVGTLVARSIAGIFTARVNASRIAAAVLPERRGAVPPTLIRLEDATAKRKELDSDTFYSAGMAVFFLFFAAQSGIVSILDERRDGTLARLLVAPIPRPAVLAGKAVTTIAVGVASMATLAVATWLILGAHWGSPAAVALLILAGVIAATAVMTLVATLARNTEQANTWGSIVALVLGMLGGSFFPVARAGGIVEKLSLLTPHAWFLRGLEQSSSGDGVRGALVPAGAILAIAAVAGALALLRAGRLLRA